MRLDRAAMRRRLQGQVDAWAARHDWLSATRQAKLADFLLAANALLILLLLSAPQAWDWNVDLSSGGMWVFYGVWAVSIGLLVAASDIPKLPSALGDALYTERPVPAADISEWDRIRKYPYYIGVSVNLAAVAILVEMTGGLIRSPFTPVMYAIVLGGQQLGRYLTNSWYFICYGVVLSLLLVGHEQVFGITTIERVPDGLQFIVLAATFATAVTFSHVDKMKNYCGKRFPPPTAGAINFDGDDGRWRFELYVGRRFKLAPYLPGCRRDGGESEAIAAFERYVHDVVAPLEETTFSIEWKTMHDKTRLVAYLREDG